MPTDAQLADFLGVVPSTITGWRRRNTLDFKLIFKKCEDLSADYMFYEKQPMFRDPHDPRNVKKAPTNNPGSSDDVALSDLKQKGENFARTIENLPLPVETRKAILESYIRIVDEELRSLREEKVQNTTGN